MKYLSLSDLAYISAILSIYEQVNLEPIRDQADVAKQIRQVRRIREKVARERTGIIMGS